jgi:hypothetical protein
MLKEPMKLTIDEIKNSMIHPDLIKHLHGLKISNQWGEIDCRQILLDVYVLCVKHEELRQEVNKEPSLPSKSSNPHKVYAIRFSNETEEDTLTDSNIYKTYGIAEKALFKANYERKEGHNGRVFYETDDIWCYADIIEKNLIGG